MKPYKFRRSLLGHSSDVRSVVCPTEQLVLSGSRDFTARTWNISTENSDGAPQLVLRGHDSYVSAVAAYVDSSGNALLFTGCHDKIIRAYTLTNPDPLYKLEGHEDNVCSLATGPNGILVSGSWDKSAKVWKDKECLLTIRGHEAAVWCVLLLTQSSSEASTWSNFLILTGSADRSIKLWSVHGAPQTGQTPSSTLLLTFNGHNDCVRSLTPLDADRFLSSSNDASIRAWHLVSGQCVGEFYGHTSFVYSVGTRPDSPLFVSSGEDRSVRVWAVPSIDQWGPGKQFSALQCIPLPCQSVWCVCFTPQLDILAGGSDSSIRMFSADPSRQASADDTKAYEAELSSAKIATPVAAATGDLDLTKLPGIEALLQPGKREGHVIVIQQDGRQVCYQWSASEARWLEIGDVVGTGNSKLPVYNGKEYDFVFSVDISDQLGHLKLPYNRTEDPWVVAQRFIHEHDLPQDYLETIAKFIVTNAGPPVSTPAVVSATDGISDPFTGSDRYIPSPQYNLPKSPSENCLPSTTFIPLKSVSLSSLLTKLESFNQAELPQNQISASQFSLLREFSFDFSDNQAETLAGALLDKVTKWPVDKLFPLLDVLRCLVFWSSASALIFSQANWNHIYSCSFGNDELPQANCLLVLRLLANALSSDGPTCLDQSPPQSSVPQSVITAVEWAHELNQLVPKASVIIAERKPYQIALATYVHNLAVLSHLATSASPELLDSITAKIPSFPSISSLCIRIGLAILALAPDQAATGAGASATQFHPDAIFALLVAVGTALLTLCKDLTETDEEAIKTHRIYRITLASSSAVSNGGGSVEELASSWDNIRRVLTYWAQTPTCLPKVRGSASALLRLLE